MNWFNKMLVGVMPIAPRPIVGMVAKRYIAGETLEEGIEKVRSLNERGYIGTMDVLGESVTDKAGTQKPMDMYRKLIGAVGDNPDIQTGISVKLTQLGLSIDKEFCWENMQELIALGKEIDLFIRIDMEDSSVTSDTLEIFERSLQKYSNMGIVIQAYMKRSRDDIQHLIELGVNVRLCKGIYNEPASIAYKDKEEIRENYIELAKMYLDAGKYIGIATHDDYLIDHLYTYIKNKNISKDQYEFQALLGVPIDNILDNLVSEGNTVRIYIPFGEDWYAYSSRRLKENPDIAGYVVKDFFKR